MTARQVAGPVTVKHAVATSSSARTAKFVRSTQGARRLDVNSVDAVRAWAERVGEDLVDQAPLARDVQLVALSAFAQALGGSADKVVRRRTETVSALTEVAEDGVLGPDELDLTLPAVWGPPVTEGQRGRAESENLRRAFLARQDVVAKSVSRATAAELLGLSEQAVTKRLDRGQMIGFKLKGQWAIPSWQLDADSQDGLLPGIAQLSAKFPGAPVALSRWVIQPSQDLAGRSPREVLASNRVDEVVRVASALTAAGW